MSRGTIVLNKRKIIDHISYLLQPGSYIIIDSYNVNKDGEIKQFRIRNRNHLSMGIRDFKAVNEFTMNNKPIFRVVQEKNENQTPSILALFLY